MSGRDRRLELAARGVQPGHEVVLHARRRFVRHFHGPKGRSPAHRQSLDGRHRPWNHERYVQAAFDKLTTGLSRRHVHSRDGSVYRQEGVGLCGRGPGVLSTAGGLLFMAGGGGMTALDAKTGKLVWQVSLGQPSAAAPMTYMYGGKQYLVLAGAHRSWRTHCDSRIFPIPSSFGKLRTTLSYVEGSKSLPPSGRGSPWRVARDLLSSLAMSGAAHRLTEARARTAPSLRHDFALAPIGSLHVAALGHPCPGHGGSPTPAQRAAAAHRATAGQRRGASGRRGRC